MSSEHLQALPVEHVPLPDGAVGAAREGSLILQLAEGHVALVPCRRGDLNVPSFLLGQGFEVGRREESRGRECSRQAMTGLAPPRRTQVWGDLRNCGCRAHLRGRSPSLRPLVPSSPTLSFPAPLSSSPFSLQTFQLLVFTQSFNTPNIMEAGSIETKGMASGARMPGPDPGAATDCRGQTISLPRASISSPGTGRVPACLRRLLHTVR